MSTDVSADPARSTGELLPLHLKPQPDETFDSWVLRLASAHALPMREFLLGVSPTADVDDVARCTGVSARRAAQTLLRTVDEDSEDRGSPRADTYWVVEAHQRSVHDPGQPYCPICWSEDAVPYVRRRWLRSYVNLCDVHGVGLLDRCIICSKRVAVALTARHGLARWAEAPVVLCGGCGGDLREGAALARAQPVDHREIMRAARLVEAVRTGWITPRGMPRMRAHAFFPVLAVLVRLMAQMGVSNGTLRILNPGYWRRGNTKHLRHGPLVNDLPLTRDPFGPLRKRGHPAPEAHEVPARRRRVLADALWLLDEWPRRFIETFQEEEIYDDTLLLGFAGEPPHWYHRVVAEHLQRRPVDLPGSGLPDLGVER